jgi:hypothetical protein
MPPNQRVNKADELTYFYKNIKWTKYRLKGQNLGHFFNFRRFDVHTMQLYYFETKLLNLKLKLGPNNFYVISHWILVSWARFTKAKVGQACQGQIVSTKLGQATQIKTGPSLQKPNWAKLDPS